MKTRSLIVILPLFLLLVITLTSGIYRHDRPVEKYLALANEEQFDCVGQVVAFKNGRWDAIGSCVLIDSVTILSAAHCFIEELKKDTIVNYQGQKFQTYITIGKVKIKEKAVRFFLFNTQLSAKSIVLHPAYLKDETCDLAIIKLDKPVKGYKKLPLNFSFNEIGDTVTGVGYGVSGPANQPELVNLYHIKLAGQNMIDSVGGVSVNGKQSMLFADFDSPNNEGCNKTGSSKPLELEYSIGAGDSGGPLFNYKNKTLQLVGIACYSPKTISNLLKNGYYCELNAWTRVSAFSDWITKNR